MTELLHLKVLSITFNLGKSVANLAYRPLILLHSEWPKLYRVLAILTAIGLKGNTVDSYLNAEYKSLIRAFQYRDSEETSKFGEFISPAEVALLCLKFILSFIKFCSLVT